MNQTTIFRLLVVTSFVAAILAAAVDVLVPSLLPAAIGDAYDAHVAAAEPTLSRALMFGGFAIILFIGVVIGAIGLFLFKPWGRSLSLWLSVVATLSYPLLGPVVYSGWAAMFTDASMMLWGAVLAMAYFAEIKVRFAKGFADHAVRASGVSQS